MQIRALLIDADGVIQHTPIDWPEAFAPLLGGDIARARTFTAEIYAAEGSALAHPNGCLPELNGVLEKWKIADKRDQVFAAMHAIEIYGAIIDVIQRVRRLGITCHIASNQHAIRARYMSQKFGYPQLFESEFYSCFLGAAKPDARFFQKTVATIGHDGQSVLFIDDREENVEAARRAGLHAAHFLGARGAEAFRALLKGFSVAGLD